MVGLSMPPPGEFCTSGRESADVWIVATLVSRCVVGRAAGGIVHLSSNPALPPRECIIEPLEWGLAPLVAVHTDTDISRVECPLRALAVALLTVTVAAAQ